jgi:hypothetical protein
MTPMALLDIFRFRRRPPIHDLDELALFIDENAAFLVQKGIYEYSRARAGHSNSQTAGGYPPPQSQPRALGGVREAALVSAPRQLIARG